MSDEKFEFLKELTLDEMDALTKQIHEERHAAQARAREEFDYLVEQVKLRAAQLNINPAPYFSIKKDKTVKYRHPDSGETWTGRGARPGWVKRILENVPAEQHEDVMRDYLILPNAEVLTPAPAPVADAPEAEAENTVDPAEVVDAVA